MLSRSEIREALLATGSEQQDLFAKASRLRDKHFGRAIIIRSVIEITNVCRVNCNYCPMRRDNVQMLDRYFMSPEAIFHRAELIREAGIDIVLLQGGETPRTISILQKAIPELLRIFNGRVEVLLNLGNMSREQYQRLRDLGATSYIIKHETSDESLFWGMRHEKLADRLVHLRTLLNLGYKVGTGLISSLPGQSLDSVIDDIVLAGKLGVHMCSVSPFVPAPNTPLAAATSASLDLALNVIAALRICYPHLLIPSVSALEKTSSGGQSRGLAAGANVLTVNFTGDADVGRYLIYGKDRFVVRLNHVQTLLGNAGLVPRGSVFLPGVIQ